MSRGKGKGHSNVGLSELWKTLVRLASAKARPDGDLHLPLTVSPRGPTRGSEPDFDIVSEI
jgi:hypothetical protein